ncbi:MAG: hypothetical protein KIB40_03595 [Pantoea sp.]|uniref:Bbp19-like phage domain-containing protein n=1 Tax=Pantoea brenneri TaxID=472694 RepID=A0AAX3J3W6_9GAMM|nr:MULTISPECIES: hypothetical protein [Pantoea]MBS6032230.1 hypothetical protein [Pantoea sp.]VXB51971.1 conserved hypothetical protein [Pantoea brenneri]
MTDFDDEQRLKDAEQKQKLASERQRDDLIHVMSSVQGRRLIWLLLSKAGVFSLSFTGDNASTNFNEGRRSEGLRLFNEVMTHCPDLYLTMANEASEDQDNQLPHNEAL